MMRGQVMQQCRRLISSQVNQTRTSSTIHQKWLSQSQSPQAESLSRSRRQNNNSNRHMSTSASVGQREVILPGNIVQSPVPDALIPEEPFHEFLFQRLDQFGEAPAMHEFLTGKSYSYQDVKTKTIKAASALARLGYKKGDTILAFSVNHNDYPILMMASSCLGLIFTAANPTFTAKELAIQIKSSGSKAIFTIPQLAEITKEALKSEEVSNMPMDLFVFGAAEGFQPFQNLLEDDGKGLPDVSIDPRKDVFLLPYSSGTTGLPKGVMLTHHNIVSNLLQIRKTWHITPEHNTLGLLPLYHIYGMVAIQFSLLYGGGQINYLPSFDPESFLKCLHSRKINMAHIVPPLILFLAKHPVVSKFDLSNLKTVMCAAAPLGKELTIEFKKRFAHEISVDQGYGMTELSPASHVDNTQNVPSVGALLCNTLSKIVDLETGKSLGPNQEGEVLIKGPQVMKGYLNNKQATDDMIDSDGWLHTGDIGSYDEKGFFYVNDRLKELIKYKGSQVAPAELEALLFGHDAVQDVAVTGIPDVEAGELPRAFIVKKPDATASEEDIIKYVEKNVAPAKRLRGGVKFIEAIPKNPSGKILRRLLKNQ